VSELTDDQRQARVDELLRKAEDFRRHGEDGSADAALALAEKMMIKYSIDAAVLTARRTDDRSPIEIVYVPFTGIYRAALAVRFDVLARTYMVSGRSFIMPDGKTHYVGLVGRRAALDQLKILITSIHLQAMGSLSRWWTRLPKHHRSPGMEGYKARRQYVSSFVNGATSRIELSRRVAMDDAEPGTALVLRTDQDEIDEYVTENLGLRPVKSQLLPGSADAARAGYTAGQQANTGDTPVATDRRRLTT
jgi:hypothetical protein